MTNITFMEDEAKNIWFVRVAEEPDMEETAAPSEWDAVCGACGTVIAQLDRMVAASVVRSPDNSDVFQGFEIRLTRLNNTTRIIINGFFDWATAMAKKTNAVRVSRF